MDDPAAGDPLDKARGGCPAGLRLRGAPPNCSGCGKLRQGRGNFASLHRVTKRKDDNCTVLGWSPSARLAPPHSVKFGSAGPSMRVNERLIIEATYASWAAQDLSLVGACLHDDAIYLVHLPPGAWFICGAVRGKSAILRSLGEILRDFEVVEYSRSRSRMPMACGRRVPVFTTGTGPPACPTKHPFATSGASTTTGSGASRPSMMRRACALSSRW